MNNEFISRVHNSSDEIDWYRLLGPTNLEKHLSDFGNINWKDEYWTQEETNNFNFPFLEVIDFRKSIYLSISVCPNTYETFQFYIGLGGHKEYMKNGKIEVERKARFYGTSSENMKKTKRIICHFFNRNLKGVIKEFDKMWLIDEIEDLYQNLS